MNDRLNDQLSLTTNQVDYLLSPPAIRERAKIIYNLTLQEETAFKFHPEKLQETVDYVLHVIRQKYPDLRIPFHSRWGHFRAGGIDRAEKFKLLCKNVDVLERARAELDLVITSVLLDAGAGPKWSYLEKDSQKSFARSEGLGVASYHLFCSGALSSDKKSLRADAEGLRSFTTEQLHEYFQVSEKNPLVGVEGRVALLQNLGRTVENNDRFINGRPGNILDHLISQYGRIIPAPGILKAVLQGFGAIWPGRLAANGVPLGDVWIHSQLGTPGSFESLVPIHKLSQWMTYSLIEPIEAAGLTVTGVEELTGLAEYRNGGLLIDSGLLSVRQPEDLQKSWTPDSKFIIEWRALTIHLLDQIGHQVQKALGKSPTDFPLAKVLEGGTWWAGRALAQEKRKDGSPPLNILSDGTVF